MVIHTTRPVLWDKAIGDFRAIVDVLPDLGHWPGVEESPERTIVTSCSLPDAGRY